MPAHLFMPPDWTHGLHLLKQGLSWLIATIPDFPYKFQLIALLVAACMALLLFMIFRLLHIAVMAFVHVIFQDPNLRGERHLNKGRIDKAIKLFRKAGNHFKLGQCYLRREEYGEAAKYFEQAKEYELAGKYYAQVGQHAKAAAIYELAGRPMDAAEKYEMAGDHLRAAELYRKLHHLKKAEEMFTHVKAPLRIAEMYAEEYRYEKKRSNEKSDPRQIEKRQQYIRELAGKTGYYYAQANNHAQAAKIYLEGGYASEAAASLVHAGQYHEAAQLFIQCNQKLEAAQAYEKGGRLEEALEYFRTVQDHDGTVRVLEALGRTQEAAELRALVELKRGQKLAAAQGFVKAKKFAEAADLYKEVGDFREAAKWYGQLFNYNEVAQCYLQAGDLEAAAQAYIQANRFSAAAQCYLKLNNPEKYIDTLLLGSAFLEAGIYLEEKNDERAINILQKIDVNMPDFRFACNLLGRIFSRKGMESLAQEKLEQAVKDQPLDKSNIDFYYDLANFRAKQQPQEALKIYDAILALDYHYKDTLAKQQTLMQAQPAAIDPNVITLSGHAPAHLLTGSHVDAVADAKEKAINQRYRVERELGRGGMGIVYSAWDKVLERKVALKFLPMAISPQSQELQKFLQEARSAARLNHPNIVTIHDIDLDQASNTYFIVMEHVDGVNLKEIIDASHHLPFNVITLISLQICEALHYAHQKNVVHRDIKNANILWTNDKVVKVTDFGLAKIIEKSLAGSTKAIGSPIYMSPEQVLGNAVDPRSDIYSLGISLYEMVTGKVPFDRGDISYHHLHSQPLRVDELRPETPALLNVVIQRCLEKKPEDRYQSIAELKTALNSQTL